jgi:glutamate-1-semialdehyde 2,1-aminomutase
MDLQRKAEKYMPGGTLGIVNLPERIRPVMVRGSGSRVWDSAGKEYIDYVLGSGPLLVGHAHPAVVEAVQKQAALSSTFYLLNEPAILLAEQIVEAVPCGETVKFQLGGSDATFGALRLSRAATGRRKIVKFEGAFHGWHDIAQHSIAFHGESFPSAVPESAGISPTVSDEVLVARFNDLESLAGIVRDHHADIAAIIVEPMQRTLSPLPGFLAGVREIASRHGIVLIFDEVVTGFRLAWGGAQEAYGVTPDIACYGKAIGGGYPISAIVGRRELLERASPTLKGGPDYCYVGGTFSGNPVSAAAGLATLDVLRQDGVYDRLNALGRRLRTGLEQIGALKGIPLSAVGEGSVSQLVFTAQTRFTHLEDFANSDTRLRRLFAYEMIRSGVSMLPDGKLYTSLAHSESDIDETIDRAASVLDKLAMNIKQSG